MTSAARNPPSPGEGESEQSRERREREQWVEDSRRIGTLRAERLREAGMREAAGKLLRCVNNVKVEVYRGRIRAIRLNPCRLRLICPLCNDSWAAGHVKKYGIRLRQAVYRGRNLHYLTLTVPSVPVLTSEVIEAIGDSWRELRSQSLFDGCAGTLMIMEVRKGVNGWQVNLNTILIADSMIDINLVRNAWYALTEKFSGGYQVHIQPVDVQTVKTLIHYALKCPEVESGDDLRALIEVMRGKILVCPTGQARHKNGRSN